MRNVLAVYRNNLNS